jgi:glycine/D-amino acid oxidase-like deaminating enzyme
MQREDRTEVLVVGAGPVGLFTALRLAGSGLRVQLIDQEPRTAGRSYACALHSRTLQLPNEEGLAGRMRQILLEKGSPDLLEAYQQEQHTQWERLLGRQGDPKAGAATDSWVRQHGGRLMRCLPALDGDLTLLLRQLGLEFEFAGPPERSAPK